MAEGCNVIITIGSRMGDATALQAKQYPGIKFAIIDTTQGKQIALKLIGNDYDVTFAIGRAGVNDVLLAARETICRPSALISNTTKNKAQTIV